MIRSVMPLAEAALSAATPEAAGRAFLTAAEPLGAVCLRTQIARRPDARVKTFHNLTTFVMRIGWGGEAEFDRVCAQCEPLRDAVRTGVTRYRLSDLAPAGEKASAAHWRAMAAAGLSDILGAASYGAGRSVISAQIGVATPGPDPDDACAIQMAAVILTEWLMQLAAPDADAPDAPAPVRLTPRERDTLCYAAEGKADWEIAVIVGVSESTARFHVDNARRKLGAVNRTHAVARLAIAGML